MNYSVIFGPLQLDMVCFARHRWYWQSYCLGHTLLNGCTTALLFHLISNYRQKMNCKSSVCSKEQYCRHESVRIISLVHREWCFVSQTPYEKRFALTDSTQSQWTDSDCDIKVFIVLISNPLRPKSRLFRIDCHRL